MAVKQRPKKKKTKKKTGASSQPAAAPPERILSPLSKKQADAATAHLPHFPVVPSQAMPEREERAEAPVVAGAAGGGATAVCLPSAAAQIDPDVLAVPVPLFSGVAPAEADGGKAAEVEDSKGSDVAAAAEIVEVVAQVKVEPVGASAAMDMLRQNQNQTEAVSLPPMYPAEIAHVSSVPAVVAKKKKKKSMLPAPPPPQVLAAAAVAAAAAASVASVVVVAPPVGGRVLEVEGKVEGKVEGIVAGHRLEAVGGQEAEAKTQPADEVVLEVGRQVAVDGAAAAAARQQKQVEEVEEVEEVEASPQSPQAEQVQQAAEQQAAVKAEQAAAQQMAVATRQAEAVRDAEAAREAQRGAEAARKAVAREAHMRARMGVEEGLLEALRELSDEEWLELCPCESGESYGESYTERYRVLRRHGVILSRILTHLDL